MKKKQFYLVPVVTLIISFTTFFASCQNSESVSEEPSTTTTKVTKFDIQKYSDTHGVLNMFEQYKTKTRSLDINSEFGEYDFSSAYVSTIEGKDVNIYMIPSKNSKDELLVGLTDGSEEGLEYQLYLKKTSENEYTLYNESSEPMFSVNYDELSQLTTITNVYGNDATVMPMTRVRGGWFSVACNVAVAAGCYGLSAIGAVPSGGASLGLAVCATTISLALC